MLDKLEVGPLAAELEAANRKEKRDRVSQCKSRLAGLRCQKPVGHRGQHANQVVRVVRSARWD